MNCRNARRRLATFRPDDQLSADLAAHLDHCGLCRSVFDGDRAVWSLLAEYTAPLSRVPRSKDVLQRLRTDRPRLLFPSGLIPTRGLAATVAAVVIMGTIGGLWCGHTLVDLRVGSVPPTVSSSGEVDEANLLTATPPGSLAAAYLERTE